MAKCHRTVNRGYQPEGALTVDIFTHATLTDSLNEVLGR
jgi:hypothetical protein